MSLDINTLRTRFSRLLVLLIGSIAALGVPLALSGCNTMEGAGQDVEAAGEEIEDAAD